MYSSSIKSPPITLNPHNKSKFHCAALIKSPNAFNLFTADELPASKTMTPPAPTCSHAFVGGVPCDWTVLPLP